MAAMRQYAEAAALFEKLWIKRPSAELALRLHGMRMQGKLGKEVEPLEEWLAMNPRDVAVRATLAEALRVAGENRRAIAEYERLLEVAPRSPPALNNLAWSYYLEKDREPWQRRAAPGSWQRRTRMSSIPTAGCSSSPAPWMREWRCS